MSDAFKASGAGAGDDGIPVLTDVIAAGVMAAAAPAATAATAARRLATTQKLFALDANASAGPLDATQKLQVLTSDNELDELTLRVQARVLAGLMPRIDPVVDQRLRESLTDLLEQVLAGMTAELKVTARRIVRDAVAQAVAAELARLHKSTLPPA